MSKKKIQACQLCNKKYNGVFVSEHICKRCTRSVCKDCADKKGYFFIAAQNKKSEHRMCNACWIDIDKIESIVKQYDITYNSLSVLAKNWTNFVKESSKQKNIQFQKQNAKIKQAIKKLNLSSFYSQLNYSFRTFLGTCSIKSKQYGDYLKILNRGLLDIDYSLLIDKQVKPQQIQNLIQRQINLSFFMMCHSDINHFPSLHDYYVKILKKASVQKIVQIFKMIMTENTKQKVNPQKTKQIEKNVIKYLKCNFQTLLKDHVNLFHIQIVNWLINEIFLSDNGTQFFQIFCAYILYSLKSSFLDQNDDLIKIQMFKNISLKQIQLPIKFLKAKLGKEQKIQTEKVIINFKNQLKQSKQIVEKKKIQLQKNQEEDFQLISQKLSQKEMKFIEDQKEMKQNLANAKYFLDKIQAGEQISQQYLLSLNIDNIDQYLDQIIRRNDQDLKQLQQMDKMIQKVHFKIQNQEL